MKVLLAVGMISSSILVLSAAAVLAQDTVTANVPTVELEVPIGTTVQVQGLAQYVQVFYRFAVSGVSILAAVMIMYAGISWLTAAGNTARIGEAKERITAAIVGIILTMMSYVILSTLNPKLVSLETPELSVTAVPTSISNVWSGTSSSSSSSSTSGGVCPAASDWVSIYDTLSASNATAASIYQANHGSTNLGQLEADVVPELEKAILAADAKGMVLFVNGDSRTYATQQYLYNCYITCSCNSCNLAAKPDCSSSPHLLGRALDLSWYPKSGGPYSDLRGYAKQSCNGGGCVSGSAADNMDESQTALQTMMQTSPLSFKRICKEWWHFEYLGPSSSVCQPGQY